MYILKRKICPFKDLHMNVYHSTINNSPKVLTQLSINWWLYNQNKNSLSIKRTIDIKNRLVVSRELWKRGKESNCLIVWNFFLGWWRCSKHGLWGWLHNSVNLLSLICTSETGSLILCKLYRNKSIKMNKVKNYNLQI